MRIYVKSLFVLLGLSSCGYQITQDKAFEVKPIEVHHTFDFTNVETYYFSKCFKDLHCTSIDTVCKDAADACAKDKTIEFLDAIASIAGPK